jgi:hypothetical protein
MSAFGFFSIQQVDFGTTEQRSARRATSRVTGWSVPSGALVICASL